MKCKECGQEIAVRRLGMCDDCYSSALAESKADADSESSHESDFEKDDEVKE